MLPPPTLHPPKKTINLRHCWPPSTPRPEKNPPAALVIWFRVCSGVGDVSSSFDATSLQKKSTCGVVGLLRRHVQKKQSTCGVGGLAPRSSGIGDVASSNAASPLPQKTVVLLASFDTTQKKTINLRCCWFDFVFATLMLRPSKKQSTCGVAGLL